MMFLGLSANTLCCGLLLATDMSMIRDEDGGTTWID